MDFFAGVPDSLLKDVCAYIADNTPPQRNIIAANEGGAVGVAIGYHLATGKIPLVYMQNSGLGNIVNPILSLADKEVYGIPMLCLIGWRGEPGQKDEPQHVKQGRISEPLLRSMEIPVCILSGDSQEFPRQLEESYLKALKGNEPVGLLVRKGLFEPYSLKDRLETAHDMVREDAVKLIIDSLNESDIVVSTTGMTSREVYEYREELGQGHARDFLTVGGMGHASKIALGITQQIIDRNVYCLDGDGAAIMHLGALPIIGAAARKNLKHIIINNGAHDSVGGQPTVGFDIDFCSIARASGYSYAESVDNRRDLASGLKKLGQTEGTCLLEIQVNKGARKNLGRPKSSPEENKLAFMDFLGSRMQ